MPTDCKHNDFNAHVAVNILEDTGQYAADVTINCSKCGRPFQFLNLPIGVDTKGATISADGLEARLAIAPQGTVPQPLDGHLVRGFRLRNPKDH